MRYLSQAFALGALRRGLPIEQFLGPVTRGGEPGIQWVSIESRGEEFEVRLHVVQDVGSEHFADLGEFPPLDPEQEESWIIMAETADELEALELAERLTGAVRTRWVNFAVAAEDYLDYVRSARRHRP